MPEDGYVGSYNSARRYVRAYYPRPQVAAVDRMDDVKTAFGQGAGAKPARMQSLHRFGPPA